MQKRYMLLVNTMDGNEKRIYVRNVWESDVEKVVMREPNHQKEGIAA